MKSIYAYAICAFTVQAFLAGICNAQTIELKPAPAGITIDGSTKEWGDELSYTDAKTKISYTLTNDKDNIYLAVKTKDPVQQSNILGAGLTFGIDTKGRKKSSFILTYPFTEEGAGAPYVNMTPAKAQMGVQATKFKKIRVEGFKDITDEQIGTVNPHGIQTAITYDANGFLIYEAAIPLLLFHAGDLATKEWSFTVKLNSIQGQEREGGQRASVVANGTRPSDSFKKDPGQQSFSQQAVRMVDLTPTIDFSGKFTLAKAQ
jgi:ribosomal protein S5